MTIDPVDLAVFGSSAHSIAEEMGAALRRASYSPNIKERRDYSCAVFDSGGNAIAMGDHMPVHLGSMPMSVKAATERMKFLPGDVALLNDPYAGGTHLPDITMVRAVFARNTDSKPLFFVAARAHHADVGGRYPGSMGSCDDIYQEGLRIPPVKLVREDRVVQDVLDLLLYNVRTPQEREGDLTAQLGACRIGESRVLEITEKFGIAKVQTLAEALVNYSETMLREELRAMPEGVFEAEDFLDDDGWSATPIPIRVAVRFLPKEARVEVDFSGSANQVKSSVNAVYAIACSVVFYVFRCLLAARIPATAGLMRPIVVKAREGSIVNAVAPAPVAGGNVETSQRIVDVLMKALAQALPDRIPAASSGTMNNLTVGGLDTRSGRQFAYYETIAGGMGARPMADGLSGVHTHMTNSLNTPAEALEYAYPLRVRRYSYRDGSGGKGRYRGGDGLVREIELLDDAQVTMLADRRRFAPYGLQGGEPGGKGMTTWVSNGEETMLAGKCSVAMRRGDVIRIESPGAAGLVLATKRQSSLSKKHSWLFVAAALLILAGLVALGRDQICRLFVPILFANDGPAKADIIFVLGGDNELRGPLAARLLEEGWAQKILLARLKDQPKDVGNQTDLLRAILVKCGASPNQIVEIRPRGGVDSTADEARALRAYASQRPMNRMLVVTSSFHGHRARMAMQRALAHTGIQVRVVTAESKFASREHWRDTEIGRMQIEGESLKIVYYFLTFFG